MFTAIDEPSDVEFERIESPFPPDSRYPSSAQYDLIIVGTSVNRFAPDGSHVRCVNIEASDIEIRDGDMVHVEHYRAQRSEVETTLKVAQRGADGWQLVPYSLDPKWQKIAPLVPTRPPQDGETIEIVGIVLFEYRPAPQRR
jgi:hypothetical protein